MRKTPGKTPAARERYWTKIIVEARKYPNGITEYCRVMNVEKNNYYFWFKRLRPKHPEWHDLSNHPETLTPQKKTEKNGKGEGALPETVGGGQIAHKDGGKNYSRRKRKGCR
ncbi:MAG: hypothetical protein SGJ27_29950 [Candidatus Melainabacteria bacterium]|nr:hypothetical protein [Candidatus Melainabacteria bacterium]